MFDIGFSEMVLLGAIALIAIGPKQLPEVARTVGRMINEFKRATGDFTRTLSETRESAIKTANDARESYNQSYSQVSQAAPTSASTSTTSDFPPLPAESHEGHQTHFGDTLQPGEEIFFPIDPHPHDHLDIHPQEEQLVFSMGETAHEAELPKRKEES